MNLSQLPIKDADRDNVYPGNGTFKFREYIENTPEVNSKLAGSSSDLI